MEENPLAARLGDEFFSSIPKVPGVYFMLGQKGELLYIGKAKNLRARLLSYKRARPGQVPERTLRLVSRIHEIRWEVHRSEQKARVREHELLHAVRPPYNVASTEELHYLFIGLREIGPAPHGLTRFEFHLTSEALPGIELFGCYRQRPRTKRSYSALLRILAAGAAPPDRNFHYPSFLCRDYPPWQCELRLPSEWSGPLRNFLRGKSLSILRQAFERVVVNDVFPRFMYPSLRDDLALVRDFYRFGPSGTKRLRKQVGSRGLISRQAMDECIAKDLESSLERADGGHRS